MHGCASTAVVSRHTISCKQIQTAAVALELSEKAVSEVTTLHDKLVSVVCLSLFFGGVGMG